MPNKRETIKIDFIYEKFKNSGLNYFESLSEKKTKRKIDKRTYRKIVKRFFSIYFNEVYFLNRRFYFLFGGYITKVRCGNWIRETKNKKSFSKASHSIGLFWYNRPCARFWFSFTLRKMKGSSNQIPKIEKDWKNSNDIFQLPLSKVKKRELKESKQLFKNTI